MSEEYEADQNEQGIFDRNNEPTEDESPFMDLYKYSNKISSMQEKRRKLFLQKLKEKRCEAFDEKRDLSELFPQESCELMECDFTKRKVKKYPFGFKLMGSEWFTEVPDDLSENWLFKLCPEGIRYLVIANKAVTTCYFRNGRSSIKFKSNLPGGSPDNLSHKFTVLDCVFNKNTGTFFVYDVLAWNSMSLINAEAHMRFFWIKSKFEEDTNLSITRHPKNYHFVIVDFYPAQLTLLQDLLFTPFKVNDDTLPIEAVLFYHKEGHYISGNWPLVGWLKTFMLPEVLHIDVSLEHMQNKPDDYENLHQYLTLKKTKPKKRVQKMETEELEGKNCDSM